jgi:hypothetical protein
MNYVQYVLLHILLLLADIWVKKASPSGGLNWPTNMPSHDTVWISGGFSRLSVHQIKRASREHTQQASVAEAPQAVKSVTVACHGSA